MAWLNLMISAGLLQLKIIVLQGFVLRNLKNYNCWRVKLVYRPGVAGAVL